MLTGIILCGFSLSGIAQPKVQAGWDEVPKIVKSIQQPSFPNRDYLLTHFNPDTKNALPAIQQAIKKANEEGGGRVVLPKGRWFSKGPIHLKSNVNLHLEKGAMLTFSENPEDYLPQVLTRWEGTEAYNFSPLIYAYHVHNVAITGKGTIDGNAEHGFATWRDKQEPAQNKLRAMGAEEVPVHKRVFGLGDFLRPSMIQFFGSSRILIEGITIHNSPMWVNHIIYSSDVTVRGITVASYRLNNDGVSIDSSTRVLIESNSFSTGDDSIVIKSGRDQDGWRVAKPSEYIVIRDNEMEGHNALAIGSEMSGGVRNVFMENNRLGEVSSAIYFKSNKDRGGYIENVRVRNIKVEQADVLLRFNTNYHSYRGGSYPSLYKNFVIEQVEAQQARLAIEIKGVKELPIQEVTVKNVTVHNAEEVFEINDVTDLVYENIIVNGRHVELNH